LRHSGESAAISQEWMITGVAPDRSAKGDYMKIILSRKGFDSGAGGYPSPFFVKEGRLVSLPIPEENKIYTTDTRRLYSDLKFENNTTYLDIMEQLGMKGFAGKNAHLDPDVNQNVLNSRKPGWKGLFGQCDAAQKHLINYGVQPGDIFLFFGWFRDVVKTDGKYKYVSGTDKHIIWGYMQVGEIDSISEASEYETWKLNHPHYRNKNRASNTGYIARDSLDFSSGIQGWGVFNYSDSLVLTDPNQKNRSVWKLPQFFHPSNGTKMTYHENQKRWKLHNNHCILKSVGRGQEFIITNNDNVIEWAIDLILNGNKSQNVYHQIYTNVLVKKPKPVELTQKKKLVNYDVQPTIIDNSGACPDALCEENKLLNFESNNVVSMICYRKATNEWFVVRFNLEDIDKVKRFDKWKVEKNSKKVYANIGTKNTYLHRLIYGDCKGKKVLAKNGDYFDCRRENLYVKE